MKTTAHKMVVSLVAFAMLFPITGTARAQAPLSDEEQQTLTYMREEEKLARDVYTAMFELWDVPAFSNIGTAEQRHMDAVKRLIDRYELADPVVNDTPGVFTNPELAALYADLVSSGSTASLDALRVGAEIEELDTADLREALETVDHADLERVFGNLMRGSRNHLRAFVKLIEDAGATYEPQHLTQEEFDEIVDSPMETGHGKHHGRHGRGQGKGQSLGQGQGQGKGQCVGLGQGQGPGKGNGECRGLGQRLGRGEFQGSGRGQKQGKRNGKGLGRGQGQRADCPYLP